MTLKTTSGGSRKELILFESAIRSSAVGIQSHIKRLETSVNNVLGTKRATL